MGELQITEKHCAVVVGNGTASCGIEIYSSLAKLSEEWEYYKEPEGWCIDYYDVVKVSPKYDALIKEAKLIGNYFETKEEAEKAVEKLKAWKRLKDKGFRFDGYDVANRGGDDTICGQVYFKGGNYDKEEIENDLDLLFSQEDD
jgi:hypothetical protein